LIFVTSALLFVYSTLGSSQRNENRTAEKPDVNSLNRRLFSRWKTLWPIKANQVLTIERPIILFTQFLPMNYTRASRLDRVDKAIEQHSNGPKCNQL